LIISVVVYLGMIKAHQLGWVNWAVAALITGLLPFVIGNFIIGPISGATFVWGAVFHPVAITSCIMQTLVALGIFWVIRDKDESIAKWYATILIGALALFFVVPLIASIIKL